MIIMRKSLEVNVSLNDGTYECLMGPGYGDEDFTIAEKITIVSGILANLWVEVETEYKEVTGIENPTEQDLKDYIYFQRDGIDDQIN